MVQWTRGLSSSPQTPNMLCQAAMLERWKQMIAKCLSSDHHRPCIILFPTAIILIVITYHFQWSTSTNISRWTSTAWRLARRSTSWTLKVWICILILTLHLESKLMVELLTFSIVHWNIILQANSPSRLPILRMASTLLAEQLTGSLQCSTWRQGSFCTPLRWRIVGEDILSFDSRATPCQSAPLPSVQIVRDSWQALTTAQLKCRISSYFRGTTSY